MAGYYEDDDEPRNDYWDEADDGIRNRKRKRYPMAPWRQPYQSQQSHFYRPFPMQQPMPQPMPQPAVVGIERKGLRDLPPGLLVDAAVQALVALSPLPTAPNATGDTNTDLRNLMAYNVNVNVYAKRNEQLRTVGALARVFI